MRFNEKQKKIIRERLKSGESAAEIARDYGVPRSTIWRGFCKDKQEVKALAQQIVATETQLNATTQQVRLEAIDLASEMLAMSNNVAIGAKHGSVTYQRLMSAGSVISERINAEDVDEEALVQIAKLSEVANKAADGAFKLMAKADKPGSQADGKDEFLKQIAGKTIGVSNG